MITLKPAVVRGAPRSLLGEGPVWDHVSGTLYWVDIDSAMLHAYSPGSSNVGSFSLEESASCIALCADGRLLLALRNTLALFNPRNHELERVKAVEIGDQARFNDGKCDVVGRFWVGTMDIEEERPIGALYVVEAGFRVRRILGGVTVSNGIGWSPDYTRMYYVDSPTRRVSVFGYDKERGEISGLLRSIDLSSQPGVPDGLTVDSEGGLWVALWEGSSILRIDPASSEATARVELPVPRVTSCTFGGENLDTLYITTAQNKQEVGGEAYTIKTHTHGPPTNVFKP
jgi:sugar lactone lactonase YvrE